MNKLLELISDKRGKLSTSRLGFLVWCLGTFLMFLYLSYTNNTFQEIPESVKWIFAILVGNRVGNKYLDDKKQTTSTQTTSTGTTTIVS